MPRRAKMMSMCHVVSKGETSFFFPKENVFFFFILPLCYFQTVRLPVCSERRRQRRRQEQQKHETTHGIAECVKWLGSKMTAKPPGKEAGPKPLHSPVMSLTLGESRRIPPVTSTRPPPPPAASHPLAGKLTSSNHDGRRLSVTDRSSFGRQ